MHDIQNSMLRGGDRFATFRLEYYESFICNYINK